MSIRLGYLDGAHGQVHYRTLGEGPLLVLLHWAPSNGRQYELLIPHFAARGFRVLALDMPGYGRSHKATAGWSCAQIAAEIAIALDHLADRNTAAYAVGGHLSAAVVAELAIATPQRWRRVVLDGSPTLTAEQMAKLMQSFAGLSPAISATGSHKTFVWDMTERFLHEWHPDYEANAANFATHYEYMADYLQIGSQAIAAFVDPKAPKGGLATYRAFERWPLIPVPVLALTAERDALRPGHAAALSLLRNAQQHEFPGAHPLLVPSRAQEYVKVIADFLQQ